MILSFDDDHSLRPGADQFFNMTKDKGVPVLILSAGLGGMWYFETFIVISVIWSFYGGFISISSTQAVEVGS